MAQPLYIPQDMADMEQLTPKTSRSKSILIIRPPADAQKVCSNKKALNGVLTRVSYSRGEMLQIAFKIIDLDICCVERPKTCRKKNSNTLDRSERIGGS